MNDSLLTRIWIFYRDGFREMTLGRTALDDYSYQTIHHVLYSKTFLLSLLPWREDNGREATVCR